MKTKERVKTEGAWDVRRKFIIADVASAADLEEAERTVLELPGVLSVTGDMKKGQVIVRYDASQIAYQMILNTLRNVGFTPLNNWWNRMKGGWFQYTDTNARDNAKARSAACCSRPPK